jgi:hypothetical protein
MFRAKIKQYIKILSTSIFFSNKTTNLANIIYTNKLIFLWLQANQIQKKTEKHQV